MDDRQRLRQLAQFLESPAPKSILVRHPNDLGDPHFTAPDEWEVWWDWAAQAQSTGRAKWLTLLAYFQRQGASLVFTLDARV
jgi:hypothetical protein